MYVKPLHDATESSQMPSRNDPKPTRPSYTRIIAATGYQKPSVWRALTMQETNKLSEEAREEILAAYVRLGGDLNDLPYKGNVWPKRSDRSVSLTDVSRESGVSDAKVKLWLAIQAKTEGLPKDREVKEWERLTSKVSQEEQANIRDALCRLRGQGPLGERLAWNALQKFQRQRAALKKTAKKHGYEVEDLELWLERHHPMDEKAMRRLGKALGYRGAALKEVEEMAGSVEWDGELIKVISMPGFRATLSKLTKAIETGKLDD